MSKSAACSETQIIEADLTWTGTAFEPGVRIAVNADGVIDRVDALQDSPTQRLTGRAMLPGFVNVHSHAFQRGLRGRGETFPPPGGAGSFWSWREAMYELVSSLDAAGAYEISKRAFCEMLAAGITTVGEFHYLHHASDAGGYELDEAIIRAAADAGIRLVLLQCYYKTGGVEKPLRGGQIRFRTDSLDEFWKQVEKISSLLDSRTQTLGVAPHSIRAAPIDEVSAICAEATKRHMVCHMHVEEQPLEIEECLAAYHKTPMALLLERTTIGPRFTAIHCTHTATADLKAFTEAGGNVCLCPLTEANLGDGVSPARRVHRDGGRICLGTDSNARLSFTEEMRWLEYGQRLITQSRGVLVDEQGSNARALLNIATINGARSLGIRAGAIVPGHAADFVAIDLDALSLKGWTEATLLDAFIFGAADSAIAGTCVAGNWH